MTVFGMIEKNDILTVKIDGCSSEGAGVAHHEGQAIFIRGALPSEVCRIKIIKVTEASAYGRLEEVVEASPGRVVPDCPYFGKCGGCDFRHASYGDELDIKLRRVNDALERIGGLELRASEIIGAEEIDRYRNKAIYAVSRGADGKAVTGFYRSRSHDVIAVKSCLLQSKVADDAASVLRRWMDEYRIQQYNEADGGGLIRHLFVREGMVCIVSAGRPPHIKDLALMLRESCEGLKSIILNINRTKGNTVLYGSFETIWGSDYVETSICGLRFRLSPLSFCQINLRQTEKLYGKAVELAALSGNETVLDLYCGAGAIGLIASRHARRVIGAEIVESAVRDANINAKLNGICNAEFICADASEASEWLKGAEVDPDVIFLDPPRKGLSPDVIKAAVDMSPNRIIYVSCDPATLARDLRLFNNSGYIATNATAIDMFPRTRHVECVVLMSRNVVYEKDKSE